MQNNIINYTLCQALPHKPTFWLHFHIDGAGVEWMDAGLPQPNYLRFADGADGHGGYFVAWQLDGYFSTRKAVAFLNDTIARITIGIDATVQRLPWKPDTKNADHYFPKIRRLQEIARNLPSKPSRSKAPSRADAFDDHTFWAIKLWLEDRIREYGEMVGYEELEAWAIMQFLSKERSTIRAKCRSVWNWYDAKNWEVPGTNKTKEEIYMTRKERALHNAAAISKQSRKKVMNAITGMFANEFKTKSSGKWNITKIARELGMSKDTVRKYVREFEAEE